MKTIKELLQELNACREAIDFVSEKTIEEAVKTCPQGDWMLWLAKKININERKLFLAKGKCVETVIHLMKDKHSKDAVNATINYGLGKISKEELQTAAYVAAAAYAAAAAKKENQLKTAEICREIIGEDIIEKVNKLLKGDKI